MNPENQLLIKQAVRLMTMGVTLERQRSKVSQMVTSRESLSSPKVLREINKLENIINQWSRLEQEHLTLRKKIEEGAAGNVINWNRS